ncbi:MAG: RluA family pseudouridine synthase [Polyangiaceae bacterium]
MSESSEHELSVAPERAGERVERLLLDALACTRSEVRALCARGDVRRNGRKAKKGDRCEAGDRISVRLPPSWVIAEPEQALDVRLERADLVIVSKPAGTPSVPLQPGEKGTLANALVARYPEMRDFGYAEREPGLLHRLDTQTSGLLLAARNAEAFNALLKLLQSGALKKRYLAVVSPPDLPDSGSIEASLEPDPERKGRVMIAREDAKYHRFCVTRYRVQRRGARFALVELEASPAFRHQVRAHLASIGHPIAGDALYGGEAVVELAARHALHASFLGYDGDAEILAFELSDPAPAVFEQLLSP